MSHAPIIAGRVPPHDLDSEAAALSACLLVGDLCDVVLPILGPTGESFYSSANGMIWEGIVGVRAARLGVDIVSVASWLRDREWLTQVGGASYLAQLSDATPAVAHVETHATKVYEKWRLRQLIVACHTTAAEAYGDVGESVQGFIDGHAQRVEVITHGIDTRGGLVPASVTLGPVLHKLDTKGTLFGISTGFARLDALLAGFHAGDLTIIAGRPGMGKTSIGVDIAMNIGQAPTDESDPTGEAIEYRVPFFSLEMPREQLALRMACSRARVDINKLRLGCMDTRDWSDLTAEAQEIASIRVDIDDTPAITAMDIRRKVRKLRATWERPARVDARGVRYRERRVGPIIVDYLQLMSGRGNERSREEQVGNCGQDLKSLAKEEGLPVIALAQLNRATEQRSVKDRRPHLSDLRESGRLEQDADNIIFAHRQHYYEPHRDEIAHIGELLVRKQRNGPIGHVFMRYTNTYTRFEELAPYDYQQAAFAIGDVW